MHVTSEEGQDSWEQICFLHCPLRVVIALWRGTAPFVGLTFWVELPGPEPIPLCPELKVVGD